MGQEKLTEGRTGFGGLESTQECGNDVDAAIQVLLPEPERQNSYEDEMETHVDSSDSDRDSTTVSYSLEDERIREVDDSIDYRRDDSMGEERPRPQHDDKLPRYEDIVDQHKVLPASSPAPEDEIEEDSIPQTAPANRSNSSCNIEFPLTHFYELEGRVHTDQWSIPYRKEESLGKCLLATIAMMNEGMYQYHIADVCLK